MFRYTKGKEQEKWKLIENSEKGLQAAVESGAHYATILSLDQDVDKIDLETKVTYKGPMYFDIDSTDENESLISCRKLLLSLYKNYGINLKDLVIHCSGGKGFHVLVPAKVFSTGKTQMYLPQMYRTMALEMNIENLDLGIYSGGKGRCFRLENVKRDSGRFKVKLSAAQIFCMTWDEIYPLTFFPGETTPFNLDKDITFAAEFAALFKRSEFKPVKIIPVADARLQALSGDPGCIKKILKCVDIIEGKQFNQVTLVLAMYAAGRGWSVQDLEQEAYNFIETYQSATYKTHKDKRTHIKAIYSYVSGVAAYKFNCSAVRKIVDCEYDCCPTCPIAAEEIAEFKNSNTKITSITIYAEKPAKDERNCCEPGSGCC